jgi:hypothetical protein
VLRFTWRGNAKEMGLGSAASVPLADAREKAASARRKIAQGRNPIDERKRDGGIPTFGDMADDVREALSAVYRQESRPTCRPRPDIFGDFARSIWPVVFEKGDDGVDSALRNWAKWPRLYGDKSALIANIHFRHPTWRVFNA